MSILPDSIMPLEMAHELNFLIICFRGLPQSERFRLGSVLVNGEAQSESLWSAASELFELLMSKQEALTVYMNDNFYGKDRIFAYLFRPEDIPPKTKVFGLYFRERLRQEGKDYVISDIALDDRLVDSK
jgi:hypothetical protein